MGRVEQNVLQQQHQQLQQQRKFQHRRTSSMASTPISHRNNRIMSRQILQISSMAFQAIFLMAFTPRYSPIMKCLKAMAEKLCLTIIGDFPNAHEVTEVHSLY